VYVGNNFDASSVTTLTSAFLGRLGYSRNIV
jgi:hypothetical protein